jgi:alpha-L-fucosidase 2
MPALFRALAVPVFLMSQTIHAAAPRMLNDVEYGQAAGISLRFDASIPEGNGRSPAAIIVHGGAWVSGHRRLNVEPLFKPLADAGIAWFSISYRLATDLMQFGVAIADVEAAIRHIRSHASEYNIDPDRIFLIGESAGGQLAAMAALNNQPGTLVRGVVAIYTPTDMVSLAQNSSLIPQIIRDQAQGTPWANLILARLSQLSPIEKVHPGMPPFLLIHGTSDKVVPVEQSRAMQQRIKSVGVACRLITLPGVGHGIRWWETSPAVADLYKREMIRWIREQSGEAPTLARN